MKIMKNEKRKNEKWMKVKNEKMKNGKWKKKRKNDKALLEEHEENVFFS